MGKGRLVLEQLNNLVNSPRRFGNSYTHKLKRLCESHRNLKTSSERSEAVFVDIPNYEGTNRNVIRLLRSLEKKEYAWLEAVILQGSLATDEEVAYSDLDALIILNASALENEQQLLVAIRELQNLSKHIYRQDPLQHHGWFVTTDKLLQSHFDDFFPVEIFYHSNVLFPTDRTYTLRVQPVMDKAAYYLALQSTTEAIISELESAKHLTNLYHLKSTLSKFMLLPALYLQLKLGHGVYKKESFELAKQDFKPEEWGVMNEVSAIRQDWQQPVPLPLKKLIASQPAFARKLAKRLAPKLDSKLKVRLEPMLPKMLNFARLMQEKGKLLNGPE